MTDDEHPELDFDPLDDTKLWPEDQFPFLPVGKMTLNRNPENYFAEVEQAAFGTGVLVDGLEFSRRQDAAGPHASRIPTPSATGWAPTTSSCPINSPRAPVATNQRDGQMAYQVDTLPGRNPHVNYEPSSLNGLQEAPRSAPDHTPRIEGNLVREPIERTNDFQQAGERYRLFEDWERDELISNLVDNLADAAPHIQDKMVELFTQCDAEYGRRVAEGLRAHAQSREEKKAAAVTQAEDKSREAQPY